MTTRVLAAIDIGSNSVRLLTARVGEAALTPLRRSLATTRLIAGMRDGRLSGEALARTAEAVAGFAEAARALGAGRIDAFGTSALRDAANRDEFAALVRKKCGLAVRVISGEEEARLAYAGAAPEGRRGVIDIGGGSTEMIVGADGVTRRARSAQMGAVRLMSLLDGRQDPEEMLAAAAEGLKETAGFVCAEPADKWIGVGGTITSLAAMTKKVEKYTPGAIEDFPLTRETAGDWLRRLAGMPVEERLGLTGLPPARADIIPYGAAILLAAMELGGIGRVHACDHDNLEGYIRLHMLAEDT